MHLIKCTVMFINVKKSAQISMGEDVKINSISKPYNFISCLTISTVNPLMFAAV